MRIGLVAAALLVLAGLGVWLLVGPSPTRTQPRAAEAPDEVPTGPGLQGSDAETAAAGRAKRDAAARRARAATRRPIPADRCRILVRAVGPDGKPIPDAELHGEMPGLEAGAHTGLGEPFDAHGRFEVDLKADQLARFVILTPAHVPHAFPWHKLKGGTQLDLGEVRLVRGKAITGRLLDEDGAPFSSTGIVIAPDADPYPSWWWAVMGADRTSDMYDAEADGRFHIGGLPPGTYRLRLEAWESLEIETLEGIRPGAAPLDVRLPREKPSAEPDPEWKTRVVVTGAPWPNTPEAWKDRRLQVQVAGAPHAQADWDKANSVTVTTRAKGPIDLVVVLRWTDHLPAIVKGIAPPGRTVTVPLPPTRVLQGRILGVAAEELAGTLIAFEGSLMPDGRVRAGWGGEPGALARVYRYARVEPDGSFALRGVPPGSMEVSVTGQRYYVARGRGVVSTAGPSLDVHVASDGVVPLSVVLPPGEQAKEVLWTFYAVRDGGWRYLRNGTLAVGRTAELPLEDRATGYVLESRTPGAGGVGPIVQRFGPSPERIECRIPVPRMLRGRVVGAEGKPIAHARIELHETRHAGVRRTPRNWIDREPLADDPSTTHTGIDGAFSIAAPPQGTWEVHATHLGHRMQAGPAPIDAQASTVDIVMVPALRITGTVAGWPTDSPDPYIVSAWPEDGGRPARSDVRPGGFFEIHGLAPGRCTVAVQFDTSLNPYDPEHEGLGQGVRLGVEAGARGVDVKLAPARSAALRVQDEKGRDLRNTYVRLVGPATRRELFYEERRAGAWHVANLLPGEHVFVIDVEGRPAVRVPVKPGGTVTHVVR